MADPLSISASIAGLVALADLIFRSGTKYAKGYKGAQQEVENLMREVRDLSVVLHNLELVAFDLEETESLDLKASHKQQSSLQLHHLHDCRQLLRRLETGLSRTDSCIRSNSSLERLQTRMKWPFTSTESKDMILEVQRYKQIIDTALAVDSLAKLNICLSQQSEIQNKVDGVQQTAEKILDIQVKIVLDTKRDKVLKDFGKVNPRQEYETNRKLRYGLTGLWLTQGVEFSDWYSTPGAKLWCSGIPGGGKSVLAASIIEECLQRNGKDPDKAVAYFFCTYRELPSQDPCSILSSLCMQLALQNEEAFEILQEAHDELYNSYLHTQPTSERLTEILQRISACFNRVYLIIDGLDECGDHTEASAMSLAQLTASQKGDIINIALLSRDEVVIRQIVEEDFEHIEIEARTEDVQLYVASELSQRIIKRRLRIRDPTLKDLIMKRLIEGAKGMFRWVACQLDHMCELPTDKARRKALDKLPPTLFATYDRILMKIEDYSDQVKPLVKKTLLLLASLPSVSFKQLCESISLDDDADTLEDDDTVSEEDILRWCSSLVRTKEVWISTEILTTEIEFAHFTVREYLDSLDTRPLELEYPQLRHYTLPPDGGHELRRCIYLRFLTMGNIEQSLQTYSLAQTIYNIVEEGQARETYWQAASNWSSRIGKGMIVGSKFHELAQKLLLYKTPNFCLWAVVFIVQLRSYELEKRGYRPASSELIPLAINTVLRPDFTTLHMAAALHMPEICQELLDNGSSPNLCSNFGPPLHYAVGGRSIFTETNYYPLVVTSHLHRCSTVDRLQTVRLLLSAGAKPKSEMHTPFRCNKTLFSFALSYPVSFCLNLQIIHLLVEAHVKIRDQDVLLLEKYFNSSLSFSDPQLAEISNQLPGFLKALSDGNEQDTPEFAIRQKTLDFIKKTRKNRPDHPKPDFPKNGSTEETLNYIISVINFNDKQEMEAFLATDASDLIRSRGLDPENPDYTALHLAVSRRSLQVLESLLAFGLDARAKARNGTTPIHLCDAPSSKEALLVLLRYAKTSLDRDSSGETIWHRAARKNAIDVVHVLLYGGEAEIALKMVSIEGKTPMCIAASNIFPGPSVLWQITSYCERNGILGRKDSHKYFRSSEGLLTILRDDGNNKLKDTFLKGTNLSSTPTGLRLLARCFQKAMEQGDRDACEKLFELGCPTEFDLGTVKPLTPFALSIWNNQERMVAWFCTKNAPISTVVMHPRLSLRCTALELALERPNLNDCLPLLIERYLGEGGDFSHMQFSILTIPILSCNQPGLLILLEQLEGKTFGPGESTIELIEKGGRRLVQRVTRAGTLRAMINQRDFQGETPLHLAARMNNLEAARVLIDRGAEIDAFNEHRQTPLYLAVMLGFDQVGQFLIIRGAKLDETTIPSGKLIQTACQKHHWKVVRLLLDAGEAVTHTDDGRNLLNFMTWTKSPTYKPDIELFCYFIDHGVDLYETDPYGLSPFQHLFLEGNQAYLRVILDRYSELDVAKVEGWYDDYFDDSVRALISTTRNLRYVKRKLTENETLKLCGLASAEGPSLLCRAACWDSVEAINNIIALGVKDLEHHCYDHGTPLEAAISHSAFEAVKCLVRNGALIPSELSKPKDSVISKANPDFVIRQWLFVGRHTERNRILDIEDGDEVEIKNWSGIWVAQVMLPFSLRRNVIESTLNYAKRRWQIKGKEERYMQVHRLATLKRYKFERIPEDLDSGCEEVDNACGD